MPDADYYQMTVYPKKKRPWWLWLLVFVITPVIMAVARLQLFVSATEAPVYRIYCYAPGDCSGSTGFIGGTSPVQRRGVKEVL
ncbi:MAG: hypothetical protein V8R91_01670 [Butyricimonas faecihominis]